MGSKSLHLLGLLAAITVLTSSEVAARHLAGEISIDKQNAEVDEVTNGEMHESSGRLEGYSVRGGNRGLNEEGEKCGRCEDDSDDCDDDKYHGYGKKGKNGEYRGRGEKSKIDNEGRHRGGKECDRCEDDSDDCDDDKYRGNGKMDKNSEYSGPREKGKNGKEDGPNGGEKGEYPGRGGGN